MELLDTGKLQLFTAVAQEGSFTRAAERLHLTQPTVSQQLAGLEKTLGVPLVVRQPRGIRLTQAGETLLPYAERILHLNQQAIESVLESAGQARRSMRLGVGHTLAIYLLPDLLNRLRLQQTDLEIRIQAGNTGDLLKAVATEQVELALVGSPATHPQLKITPFMEDELILVVSPDDPWVNRPRVTLKDLRRRPLITREKGSALYASVRELLGAEHLGGSQVIILNETEAIKRGVEAKLGVALIQGIAVQQELAQGRLHQIPLSGAAIKRSYNIARKRNKELSPVGKLVQTILLGNRT